MKFKQKFALLRRNTETREIAGQTFTFYPISIPMLFELKSSMEPLMKGLKSLFNKTDGVGTQTVEETRDPMTQKVIARVTHLGVPDVNVMKLKAEQSDAALRDAIEAVLGEKNRMLLGRVLADSLRDEEIRSDADVKAFITDPAFDLPLLVEMLGGFFAVNAKVFGPFAERVRTEIKARVANSLNQNPQNPDASDSAASQETNPALQNPFGTVGPLAN